MRVRFPSPAPPFAQFSDYGFVVASVRSIAHALSVPFPAAINDHCWALMGSSWAVETAESMAGSPRSVT